MLFISNTDVARVLTMEDTLRVIEEGHRELARGELAGRPRVDIYTETGVPDRFHRWGTMEGSSKNLRRFAIRDGVRSLWTIILTSLILLRYSQYRAKPIV